MNAHHDGGHVAADDTRCDACNHDHQPEGT
jgi:hypothetical protein